MACSSNSVVILAVSEQVTIQCLSAPGLPVSPISHQKLSPLRCSAHGTGHVPWQKTCFWFCAPQKPTTEERGRATQAVARNRILTVEWEGRRSQGMTVGTLAKGYPSLQCMLVPAWASTLNLFIFWNLKSITKWMGTPNLVGNDTSNYIQLLIKCTWILGRMDDGHLKFDLYQSSEIKSNFLSHLKVIPMVCTNCVRSFMLFFKSAQWSKIWELTRSTNLTNSSIRSRFPSLSVMRTLQPCPPPLFMEFSRSDCHWFLYWLL